MKNKNLERRAAGIAVAHAECASRGEDAVISGYAAKYDSLSEDLGGFFERLEPGAFAEAIKISDVRALLNHDPNKIIGRAGVNLSLEDRADGLFIEISPIDSATYWEVYDYIRTGLITQQSFGFTVGKDRWERRSDGAAVRVIERIDRLYDVSPVTYPAYPETEVAVRGLSIFEKKDAREHAAVTRFDEDKWQELIENIRGIRK